MKTFILLLGMFVVVCGNAQEKPATVKSLLLQQLKNTHTNQDWFVPINIALKNITIEQSNKIDSTSNHSISQLVSHLIFWNERELMAFQERKLPKFNDDNDLTFNGMNKTDWYSSTSKLDSIQIKWYEAVENATEERLNKWADAIANMCSHNAYHTGQIVYIRKQNNWWR